MNKTVFRLIVMSIMLLFASSVQSQDAPPTKYQAWLNHQKELADIAAATNIQKSKTREAEANARAAEAQALQALAGKLTEERALIAFMFSEHTKTLRDLISNSAQNVGSPVVQAAAAPPPSEEPPPCDGWCKFGAAAKGVAGAFVGLAREALPFVQGRYAHVAQMAATAANRDITLGSQKMNSDLFNILGTSNTTIAVAGLGAVERSAVSGFGAIERTSIAGFGSIERLGMKPSQSVVINNSGSDNAFALFSSQARVNKPVRTSINNCDAERGGDASGRETSENEGGRSAPACSN